MEIIKKESDSVTLKFTNDELVLINNALNETLNGIALPEFQTRMGGSEKAVESLLDQLGKL